MHIFLLVIYGIYAGNWLPNKIQNWIYLRVLDHTMLEFPSNLNPFYISISWSHLVNRERCVPCIANLPCDQSCQHNPTTIICSPTDHSCSYTVIAKVKIHNSLGDLQILVEMQMQMQMPNQIKSCSLPSSPNIRQIFAGFDHIPTRSQSRPRTMDLRPPHRQYVFLTTIRPCSAVKWEREWAWEMRIIELLIIVCVE